jgi:hypothetical protein
MQSRANIISRHQAGSFKTPANNDQMKLELETAPHDQRPATRSDPSPKQRKAAPAKKSSTSTGNHTSIGHQTNVLHYLHNTTTVPCEEYYLQERTDERVKRIVPRRKGMDCALLCCVVLCCALLCCVVPN